MLIVQKAQHLKDKVNSHSVLFRFKIFDSRTMLPSLSRFHPACQFC